ncbi:DsbA family protein [Goodfellowiella coeruleoviolacea]|uniref:Protein-disulfide isomerase n=1 Tax=Goodfellowiella coeruleoviolacea TaxID=334858 RepID=A0AAE3GK80_9PSEU|nr:thioredoxin domain-containing protein [Goodfellowiella coeruleoviolacea]MCP2167683.1 Protein-disulfide isomerase [Goodfellowiella coeruleoviolacea]
MSRRNRNPVTARRGPSLNLILTAVVVVLAVAVLGGVLLTNRSAADGTSAALRPPGSHTLSQSTDDKVTVVEFLDFQCPACVAYHTNITRQLEQDYQDRFTFVPRHFPLDMHPLAVPAARAAEAAGRQGRYREMHHALYDGFDSWAVTEDGRSTSADLARATAAFERFASQVGLDLDRFRADLSSPKVQAAIDQGRADGRRLGVTSTPTFFVNGVRFQPQATSIADIDRELRALIDRELAG